MLPGSWIVLVIWLGFAVALAVARSGAQALGRRHREQALQRPRSEHLLAAWGEIRAIEAAAGVYRVGRGHHAQFGLTRRPELEPRKPLTVADAMRQINEEVEAAGAKVAEVAEIVEKVKAYRGRLVVDCVPKASWNPKLDQLGYHHEWHKRSQCWVCSNARWHVKGYDPGPIGTERVFR